MNSFEDIPKPSNTGSDGSQLKYDHSSELVEATQLNDLPLANTIQGIASSNSRAFGGEVTSALVAGATTQLASELQYKKREVLELQNKIDDLNKDLSVVKIENAVLKERIASSQQLRHLRNLSIAIGTILLTASISLFDSAQYQSYGFVSLTIGVLLIIVGWYVPSRGGDK